MEIFSPKQAEEKFPEDNEQVNIYLSLLKNHNSKTNLVSPGDIEKLYHRHFLDSLIPSPLFTPFSKVLDLGTGGGFPAIALKIAEPSLCINCIESRIRKTLFLKRTAATLGFENFEVFTERVEALGLEHNSKYDFITSRAMDSSENIIKISYLYLKRNGKFVLFKAKGSKLPAQINVNNSKLSVNNPRIFEYSIEKTGFEGEIHSFSLKIE